MIQFEKEVLGYLNIPSVPLKKFDGKSFKDGVAVVELISGSEAYAVATFDEENDKEPRIKKTFGLEPFIGIKKVFVVPSYMDTSDIKNADLDNESKKAAERLAAEAAELENEGVEEPKTELPENEYFYSHIHSDEEAAAFIHARNKQQKIKGRVPKSHDALVARLGVLWAEDQKRSKK